MDKSHPEKYRWDVVRMDRDLKVPFSETLNEQIFEKLKSLVEIERMTPDERLAYELSLSVERDLSGALEASYEDGEEKGMEKGMAQGMMEGICKTARNFKALGISLTDIVKATGLPLETVQSL